MAGGDKPKDPIIWFGASRIGNLWRPVVHEDDPEHPEDKDWADSKPDPKAP